MHASSGVASRALGIRNKNGARPFPGFATRADDARVGMASDRSAAIGWKYPLLNASIQANLSLQSSIQMTTAEIENPQIHRLGNKSLLGGVRLGYTCAVDPV